MGDLCEMRPASIALVRVVWDDACHVRSAHDAKALKMMSFGLLVKDETDGMVIAQSQSEAGEFLDCLYIPRAVVVEVVKVPVPAGKGTLQPPQCRVCGGSYPCDEHNIEP